MAAGRERCSGGERGEKRNDNQCAEQRVRMARQPQTRRREQQAPWEQNRGTTLPAETTPRRLPTPRPIAQRHPEFRRQEHPWNAALTHESQTEVRSANKGQCLKPPATAYRWAEQQRGRLLFLRPKSSEHQPAVTSPDPAAYRFRSNEGHPPPEQMETSAQNDAAGTAALRPAAHRRRHAPVSVPLPRHGPKPAR